MKNTEVKRMNKWLEAIENAKDSKEYINLNNMRSDFAKPKLSTLEEANNDLLLLEWKNVVETEFGNDSRLIAFFNIGSNDLMVDPEVALYYVHNLKKEMYEIEGYFN